MSNKAFKFIPFFLLFFPSFTLAERRHDGWDGMGMGMGLGILSLILWIIFWVIVIAVVIGVIRYLVGVNRNNHDRNNGRNKHYDENLMRESSRDSALEILRERYAKGEIDKDEFDKRKNDLERI